MVLYNHQLCGCVLWHEVDCPDQAWLSGLPRASWQERPCRCRSATRSVSDFMGHAPSSIITLKNFVT